MQLVIQNAHPYGMLSEDRLRAFEKKIGVTLPLDYREFLKQYNGGTPDPSGFWIQVDHDGSSVHQFYGLHDGPRWCSIDGYTNIEIGVPGKLLPIGDDGVSDFICLGIRDTEQGAVFFVDHEIHPYSEPNSFEGITKIANSFSEFLSSLREIPE